MHKISLNYMQMMQYLIVSIARELLASTPTDAEIDAIDAMTRAMLAYQATYAAR